MPQTLKKTFFRRLNLLAILSALLFGLILVRAERLILTDDLHDKGESIAGILAAVTLDAVVVHDYATVERYVADIIKYPSITSVTVRRADHEILAQAGDAGGEGLIVRRAVSIAGEPFGEVRVVLSTQRLDHISRLLLFSTIAAVILFHLLGMLMSSLALKKAVTRPLAQLNTAIDTLRDGDFNQQINLTEPAEFSAIGVSFNSMAATIRDNFEAIGRQQEALELEQNKLATIVNSIADGVFATDNEGVITAFNPSASAISGFAEAEAVGVKCSDLFRSTLCKDACALYHAGETIRNRETTITTRDDRVLDVSVSSAMLFDSRGEAAGGVQTFRDITAAKKRQEMYCHTEKLAAIGQLAAGVAHEINNPLSNILGYARYIKPDSKPETIQRRVEVIIEQAGKCSEIVRGLLNFSRSSGARPSVFVIQNIIDQVLKMVGYQVKNKRIEITFNQGRDLPVYADPGKIEQVIFNLIMNALQTEPPASNITITCGRAGNGVYCAIADDGPGIPPEIQNKIFDPFFTTKPVGEGTGLGLSICAGIIAEADGSIDVENRPEGGSVFTVILPEGAVKDALGDAVET
jgi:two-component system NtrC family sensor kinase